MGLGHSHLKRDTEQQQPGLEFLQECIEAASALVETLKTPSYFTETISCCQEDEVRGNQGDADRDKSKQTRCSRSLLLRHPDSSLDRVLLAKIHREAADKAKL